MSVRPAWLAIVPSLAALLHGGCAATPPDVEPFADATVAVERSVGEGFALVSAELREMGAMVPEARPDAMDQEVFDQLQAFGERYRSLADGFDDARDERMNLLRALTEYADALSGIVAAGNDAGASVDAVANSVQGLANTVLANPLPSLAVDITRSLARWIVQIRAARSLQQAVESADGAVQEVAALLEADLADLEESLATKPAAVAELLELPLRDKLRYRARLLTRRDVVAGQIRVGLESPSSLDLSRAEELLTLEALIEHADRWHIPYTERQAAAQSRIARDAALIRATRAAIGAWGDAHADLAAALREGRRPNVRALISSALEIRALIERARRGEP